MMRTVLFGTIAAILTASSYAAATQQDPPARPEVTACFTNTTHSCVPVSSVTDGVPFGSFITFQLSDPSSVANKVEIFTTTELGKEDPGIFNMPVDVEGLPSHRMPGSCHYVYQETDVKARSKAFTAKYAWTMPIPIDGFNTTPGIVGRNSTHWTIPTTNGDLAIPGDDQRGMYISAPCANKVFEEYTVNWIAVVVIDGKRNLLGDISRFNVGPKSNPAAALGDVQPPPLMSLWYESRSGSEMNGVGWWRVFSVGAAVASLYLI